ncbi:MAG: pyrroline-5-carboxylate reductase, partial [Clostridia bacterium]|nr:pyrroline-5-carboxylate reductase [Clostridia bacterium]
MTSIGFIGAGNMAEAIISGILKNGVINADKIVAFDISKERKEYMREKYKINFLDSEAEILQ